MKKFFLFAVAAVAALASCSKNEPQVAFAKADDGAIEFGTYAGSAATRGTSYAVTDVVTGTKGIGVFAFYQPANGTTPVNFNTKKHSTPDFMYNQQVYPTGMTYTPYADVDEYNAAKGTNISSSDFDALTDEQKAKSVTVTKWEYNPVKYWPNNTGDQVSFFAYAPYNSNTTWEDLGFATDVNATKLTAKFPVYSEKTAMVDYLFATPALNKSKQKVAVSPATQSEDLITFEFVHIMSRVAINIGAIVDEGTADTPKAFPAPVSGTGTKITVESIEIKGIAQSYDYTYTFGATPTEAWVATGSQDLKLTKTDFQNYESTSWTEDKWYPLLAQEDTPAKPGFLFIAPQNLSTATLVITYKVATTDAGNAANNSTITNVIEKPIGVEFKTGSAYTLNLLIGMKTVELSATMTDWTVVAAKKIDVPANE